MGKAFSIFACRTFWTLPIDVTFSIHTLPRTTAPDRGNRTGLPPQVLLLPIFKKEWKKRRGITSLWSRLSYSRSNKMSMCLAATRFCVCKSRAFHLLFGSQSPKISGVGSHSSPDIWHLLMDLDCTPESTPQGHIGTVGRKLRSFFRRTALHYVVSFHRNTPAEYLPSPDVAAAIPFLAGTWSVSNLVAFPRWKTRHTLHCPRKSESSASDKQCVTRKPLIQ